MLRKETFEKVKYDESLRQLLVPYLTQAEDPYFDTFLAITCYCLSEDNLRSVFSQNENIAELPKVMKKATICEIGKGPRSRAFSLFGKDYLAVTEPEVSTCPGTPSAEHYEGTIRAEKIVDLRCFAEHSLYGHEFDITLSHGLLGDIGTTGLVAGKPSKLHMELCENEHYKRFHTISSIRNMLAIFSNITHQGGISVHRCDRTFINGLVQDDYLHLLGFTMEALLDPVAKGGFVKDEVIAVLRKNHNPKDGTYKVFVGASEILHINNGKCGIKEVHDRFLDARQNSSNPFDLV
jgi:hypothetical protein